MNKYPWLVRISTVNNPIHGFCGGTLVASKYVITACHCTYQYDKKKFPELPVRKKFGPHEILVSIGDHKQTTFNESGREKRVHVKSIKRHSKYEKNQPIPGKGLNNGYDLAILELAEELDLKIYTPACLARLTEGTRFNGERAVAYGWGRTANLKPKGSDEPYELEMKVGSPTCIEQAEHTDAMIVMAQKPRMLCAGPDSGVKAGTCKVRIQKKSFKGTVKQELIQSLLLFSEQPSMAKWINELFCCHPL